MGVMPAAHLLPEGSRAAAQGQDSQGRQTRHLFSGQACNRKHALGMAAQSSSC